MNRTDVIKEIMSQINDDDIVIASTGFISREVFKYDRSLNFYMTGSMGNALSIGIGVALNVKNRVFVINGDGSVLMGLGSMVTLKSFHLPHLHHFILDNNSHESTGGQKTSSDKINLESMNKNTLVFKIDNTDDIPPRITLSCKQIAERFRNEIIRIQK